VVFLIIDYTINPALNPSEVSHLFSMPLSAFLHMNPTRIPGWHFGLSSRIAPIPPVEIPLANITDHKHGHVLEAKPRQSEYYGFRDIQWGQGIVRMHRFLSGREGAGIKPVYGLTACVLKYRNVADGQGYTDKRCEDWL
jgi:coenzyme A diphosphatase NUDT7